MYYNLLYLNYNFSHKFDLPPVKEDEFSYHNHLIYEFLLFIQGKAEFTIENMKYDLNPGDLILIPPGYYHNINIDKSIAYERYVIKFPEYDIPEQLLPVLKEKHGSYRAYDLIINLFKRFDFHVENYKGADLSGLLQNNLKEILYYFCQNDIKPYKFETYKENMIPVIDYINVNIAKKITLDDLSEQFHYSKSYLCKEFKECMNVSIMQYIRTKRVLLAETLINDGKKPVDIYQQCGFSDYSSFFRAYKQITKKAPSMTKVK